jgi:rhomboid protease GluP
VNWKSFFDRLGMDGTRWQWRIMRWQRNLGTFFRHGTLPGGTGISATYIILLINLIWFSLMILKGAADHLGLSPLMAPNIDLLRDFGAQQWIPLVTVYGQWWRCLTYAYTHANLIHIGFNMLVLYQVGPLIEREIGTHRFITLYTLTALTATGLGYLWHPITPVVGASGAIFGLIGFAVAYYHRMGPTGEALRNFMFRWAVFAFIFGLLVGADNAGHLGGAVGGAVFGMLLPLSFRGRRASDKLFVLLAVVCAAATLASFGWQVAYWFR